MKITSYFAGVSIRKKIIGSFFFVIMFSVIGSIFAIQSIGQASVQLEQIIARDIPRLTVLLELKNTASEMEAHTISFRLLRREQLASEFTEASQKKFQVLANIEKLNEFAEKYRSYGDLSERRVSFLLGLTALQDRISLLSLDLIRLQESGASFEEISGNANMLQEDVSKLKSIIEESLEEDRGLLQMVQQAADAFRRETILFSILIIGLSFSGALLFGLILAQIISRPVLDLKEAAFLIASGKLGEKVEVQSHDELGDLAITFNNMSQKLKAAYDDLAEAKAKDEALLRSIGEGVVVADKEGRIILMNRVAQKMLGWSLEEVLGKSWFEFFPAEDEKGNILPSEKQPFQLALTAGSVVDTYYYARSDKTRFPAGVTATAVINKNFVGVILVFRDITREKEIDRAKSEFVSLAAHQLNAPLTAISGYSELLLDTDASKMTRKQKEYLKQIHAITQGMIELVRLLLNVSRIELGIFAIEPQPSNVLEIAESAIEELSAQSKEKKLTIHKELDKNLPMVPVDRVLMKMIFQNLISNAVKYTPKEGDITLVVKKDDQNMLISVADTGYGIPKEAQFKIFTKLFRAENVREKEPEGTGLGLYIVKSIIEAAGGRIWFESEENKGTTFYITLPLSGMRKREGTKGLR
jgi:two-component system sensor histidine kinase VicK